MNGFHVHAIGWILVTNARSLTPAEADELSALWTDLLRTRADDLRNSHPILGWLFPKSLPLSPSSAAALVALVTRMTAQHPERFAEEALRQRQDHWVRQAVLGFLLSGLTALLIPPSWPMAESVAPTFFLMGCACLLPAVTLWRATAAVRKCGTVTKARWQLPRNPSKHLQIR